MNATVEVTSNGQGGTLTLNWFYETVTGARNQFDTTTYPVPSGTTDATLSPPAEDFTTYSDYPTWGVTITSTPTAASGAQTGTIDPNNTSGCYEVIQ